MADKKPIFLSLIFLLFVNLYAPSAEGEPSDKDRAPDEIISADNDGSPLHEGSIDTPNPEGRGDVITEAPNVKKIEIRLFFFGNSYTSYNDLPGTFVRICRRLLPPSIKLKVASFAPGGFWWSNHLKLLKNKNSALFRLFSSQRWDWVILQEQSQIPGLDLSDPYYLKSKNSLVELVKIIRNRGAKPLLLMTWGRRNGDALNSHIYPDFLTMQRRISMGYFRYSRLFSPPLFIAPAGLVWNDIYRKLKSKGIDPLKKNSLFYKLYISDGSHPSQIGTFTAALTLCNSIFGLDSSLSKNFSLPPAFNLNISDRELLLGAVRGVTFSSPFSQVRFYWSRIWGDFTPPPFTSPPQGKWGALSSDAVLLSHYLFLPAVNLRTGISLNYLTLGGIHTMPAGIYPGSSVGGGRLFLFPGAALTVRRAIVLSGYPLTELSIQGGVLSTPQIFLDSKLGESRIILTGGRAKFGRIELLGDRSQLLLSGGVLSAGEIKGDVVQKGGTLSVEKRLQVVGKFSQEGGSIAISLKWKGELFSVPITISEGVLLSGGISINFTGKVERGEEWKFVILEAKKISLTKDFSLALTGGKFSFQLELVKTKSREKLRVSAKVIASSGKDFRSIEPAERRGDEPGEESFRGEVKRFRERGPSKIDGMEVNKVSKEFGGELELSYLEREELSPGGCCSGGGPDIFGIFLLLWFFGGFALKRVEYFLPHK